MKAFLFGLGLGIGLGVLFAPMSGQDTRNNLSDRANDLANTARETYEQGRDKVQRGINQVRNIAGSGETRPTGTETSSTNL